MTGRYTILAGLLIVIITLFHLSQIRGDHNWGGDFSMYILHSKNIAEGRPYDDTGYIFNPALRKIGPPSYPVMFPLILSTIYSQLGVNLSAMKVVGVLFFTSTLLLLVFIYREKLPSHYPIILILIIGFNPYLTKFLDSILSDIPFIFYTYLSLYTINKSYNSGKNDYKTSFKISLFIFASYATRSIGLLLLPSLWIYDIIQNRRPTNTVLTPTLIILLAILIQSTFFHSEGNYLKSLIYNHPAIILNNAEQYTHELIDFFKSNILGYRAMIIFMDLSLIGLAYNLRKKIRIYEIFYISYLLGIIIWPLFAGIRLLLPLIPLSLYYCSSIIRQIGDKGYANIEKAVIFLIISILLISYLDAFQAKPIPPYPRGILKPESVRLFNYIRQNASVDDIIIFKKPRVMALFTSRRSSACNWMLNADEINSYLGQVDASIIVHDISGGKNNTGLLNIVNHEENRYKLGYSNKDFEVYHLS